MSIERSISKTSRTVSSGGASGKLLVSYTVLNNLGEGLGLAANELKTAAERSGAATGASDVDQVINRFADNAGQLREHLQQTLFKTGQRTHQAALDYQMTDEALAVE